MSSPSENGTLSSSGRSTPDDGTGLNNSTLRRSSTPAQSFLPPRFWAQNSTYNNNNPNPNANHHIDHQNNAFSTSFPRRTSFGTTFSNGGRLSALSALGMSTSFGHPVNHYGNNNNNTNNSTNTTNTNPSSSSSFSKPPLQTANSSPSIGGGSGQRDTSPNNHHAFRSSMMRIHESAISTPDTTPTPSVPSSPVVKPRKRSVCYLPGPDGLCVESRGRRRSEA